MRGAGLDRSELTEGPKVLKALDDELDEVGSAYDQSHPVAAATRRPRQYSNLRHPV